VTDKKRAAFNIFVAVSLALFVAYLLFIAISLWVGESRPPR
jgi:hypothetical protein